MSSVVAFLTLSSAGFRAAVAIYEVNFVASVLAAVAANAASAAFLLAARKAFFASFKAKTA